MNIIKIKPYKNSFLTKKQQIKYMFDRISSRYDILNKILSFGIDFKLRKKLVYFLSKFSPNKVLDIAIGTGDMAIMIANKLSNTQIIGLDISKNMLQIARKKILDNGLEHRINLVQGDVEKIPFDVEYFDAITIAFGLRNFEKLKISLKEIYRILKPNGVVLILEFSYSEKILIKILYKCYSYYVMFFGYLFSKDFRAYNYLYPSIINFPYGIQMKKIFKSCGFYKCDTIPLLFGITSIYIVKKY